MSIRHGSNTSPTQRCVAGADAVVTMVSDRTALRFGEALRAGDGALDYSDVLRSIIQADVRERWWGGQPGGR